MSQVISMEELAKRKENRKHSQSTNKKNAKSEDIVYSTDAKFITLDGIQFGFGGAFQRDFMKNLNAKRAQVTDLVLNHYDKELEALKYDESISAEAYVQYKLSFAVLKAFSLGVIESIKTEKDFDAIFDNESPELAIISEIVLAVMQLSYSEFDYQRMIRDRWCNIDSTLTEFLASLDDLFDLSILERKQN